MDVDGWLKITHIDEISQGKTGMLRQMIEHAIKTITFHLIVLRIRKKSSASPVCESCLLIRAGKQRERLIDIIGKQ